MISKLVIEPSSLPVRLVLQHGKVQWSFHRDLLRFSEEFKATQLLDCHYEGCMLPDQVRNFVSAVLLAFVLSQRQILWQIA